MKTEPIRWRLELETEAHRLAAMETEALLSDLSEEEIEEFCVAFLTARPRASELDPKLDGAFAVARAIAEERRAKLARLRSAFESRDSRAALDIARELCGVRSEDEKSNRTHSRIH